jgi:hypothetical protein
MSNPIETPHVILGLKGPFQDFEDRRRGKMGKDSSISAWYGEAISGGKIWLSTLDNSDIISFSHKFNSDSSTHQAMYVFKILDPTNTFESRFFEAFNLLNDSPSVYITFGSGNDARNWAPVSKAKLVALEHGLTPEGLPIITLLFMPSPGVSRLDTSEEVEKYLKSTDKTFVKYGEPVEVLQGKQNEPPLPPTTGPGGKVDTSIPPQNSMSIIVRNPVNIIFSLFKNMFEGTTKSKVIFMLEEMKLPLKKLWNKAVSNQVLQFVESDTGVEGRKASKGALEEGELEKIGEKLKIKLMKDSEDETVDKEVSEGFSVEQDIEKDAQEASRKVTAALSAAKQRHEDTFKKGLQYFKVFEHPQLKPAGENDEELAKRMDAKLEELRQERNPDGSPAYVLSHEEYMEKSNEAMKKGAWYNHTGAGATVVFIGAAQGAKWGRALGWYGMAAGTVIGGGLAAWGVDTVREDATDFDENVFPISNIEIKLAQASPAFQYWYENVYVPDVAPSEKTDIYSDDLGKKAVQSPHRRNADLLKTLIAITPEQVLNFPNTANAFFSWLDTDEAEEAEKRGFTLPDPRKAYNKTKKGKWAQSITLDTNEIYRIFMGACQSFYGELGLHFTTQFDHENNNKQVAAGTDNKRGGVGDGGDPNKLMEIAKKNTHIVYLKVDSASKLKGKLANFLSLIDKETEFSPAFISFSEVSLINELINQGLAKPGTEDIFIISSFKVIQSLVNLTSLDKNILTSMEDGKIYNKVKRAYEKFLDREPALSTISQYRSLFKNPEEESLALGGDNYLKLYGDMKFPTNEKLNEYLQRENIPVFNYGFKNSNVLNFNFDLKPWYAYLVSILPQISMAGSQLPAVMDTDLGKSVLKIWLSEGAAADLTEHIGEYYDAHEMELRHFSYNPKSINREGFIKSHKDTFGSLIKNEHVVDYLLLNTENQEGAMNQLLLIRDKMSEKTFNAKITTLPLFSMMSVAKILGKTALLYFLQPEVVASAGYKDRVRSTWLSGRYMMVGFELKIEGGAVTTSFNMLKYSQD